jgi:molybdate/tungstate transport system ATP-binding protein
MIELHDVALAFPGFSLGPLELRVEAGEHVVILGRSGAGKSLLLELIAGFREVERGSVRLRGVDVTRASPQARALAWVPQSLGLFPHLTVRDNVAFPLRARGDRRDEPVLQMAERLHIEGLLARDVQSLSGGERQRVALARAFVASRDIMLLDEPFSSLEHAQRREAWELLASLRRERTIVHVTHDHEEARYFATRTLWLDGRLASAPPDIKLQES